MGPDLHQNPYPGSENAAKTTKITKVCCSEELNALSGKLEASLELTLLNLFKPYFLPHVFLNIWWPMPLFLDIFFK
jgi:hypothetical protein